MSAPGFAIEPYCDELGPEKVLHIYEPHSGLRGMVVVDNTACGPAIGGVRMAPKETTARHPAFDVTPGKLITAIVTEHGVVYPPYVKNLKKLK